VRGAARKGGPYRDRTVLWGPRGETPRGYPAYYNPDDRYGGPDGLKTLVDACHARGIAVVLDAVYAHAHPEFAYNLVYDVTGEPNPMMGVFAGEFFNHPGTDYRKEFTRDYFRTANSCWLQEYHVDGFRYDYVPGMYDGPLGDGYARLVFDTYRLSQGCRGLMPAASRPVAGSSNAPSTCPMRGGSCGRPTPTRPGRTVCSMPRRMLRGVAR